MDLTLTFMIISLVGFAVVLTILIVSAVKDRGKNRIKINPEDNSFLKSILEVEKVNTTNELKDMKDNRSKALATHRVEYIKNLLDKLK